jgi:hypothetical protein
MGRFLSRLCLFIMGVFLLTASFPIPSSAAGGFRAGHIIDDNLFFAKDTMSVAQMESFFDEKGASCSSSNPPCLKNYTTNLSPFAADAYCSGVKGANGLTAAQIIYRISHACNISAKVLIVLLQKEQGLVTTTSPSSYKYQFATGFCVYDVGPPPPSCAGTDGFANQVYYGARQYQKYANSPTRLDDYNFHVGPNYRIYYNPSTSCGSSLVNIENQATAGLYNYTPYQPNAAALAAGYGTAPCGAYGNRNFWLYYRDWFGSPTPDPCNEAKNVTGASGRQLLTSQYNLAGGENLTFAQLNNVNSSDSNASQCAILNFFSGNYKGWVAKYFTKLGPENPANNRIVSGNVSGDRRDETMFVKYSGGSGRVEVHTFTADYQQWSSNVATNMGAITPSEGVIVAGDTNGDGRDELIYVKYSGGSGRVEVHTWTAGFRAWSTNIATNMGSIAANEGTFTTGDTNGDGRDELIYVKYSGGSGATEIHTWAPGYRSWVSNIATNLHPINASTGTVIAGDTNGDGRDELMFIKYQNTGSNKVEIHTWAPGYRSWVSNVSSVLGAFDPAT